MFETEAEIEELVELLDRTLAHANKRRTAIVKPERRLNARQVVRYLEGRSIKSHRFVTHL
jgi:hypothetical protein